MPKSKVPKSGKHKPVVLRVDKQMVMCPYHPKYLTIIIHYPRSDAGRYSDYIDVTIEDEFGREVANYGDDYHDKGTAKAEGFVAGVKLCVPTLTVCERRVCDREN